MTSQTPPKLATWMLKHFGSGSDNDALLGDLAEQYLDRNSAMWYWRQAMSGIAVSFLREIRAHKAAAARTLLAGWGIWILYVLAIVPRMSGFFLGGGFAVWIEPRDPIGAAWSIVWAPVLVQAGLRSFSLVFAVGMPVMIWTLCGWLVARFHPEQETGMVLLLAGSIVLLDLLLVGPFVVRLGGSAAFAFAGPLVTNGLASVLGVLIGGGLLHHPRTASR